MYDGVCLVIEVDPARIEWARATELPYLAEVASDLDDALRRAQQ
jgi:urocanate hydratase